ncbi:hypothetical protein A9179_16675 [Pseudomonas alcaligenes]|uniref:Uncharacterized protein n=1 Tax=Aquipseudomonas alcaligenes TaxID=43263 RepID=A0ABR7S2X9_AQUAC|nr:hypothetical protein [Pseudomonas alcaligenes]MBC9251907.1 hypothetical protein [Pseudomonas alcaligenes]
MIRLFKLFAPTPRMRCYALLDSFGICRALRQCSNLPSQAGWVEVESLQLAWIGQPLPLAVILHAPRPAIHPRSLLAA